MRMRAENMADTEGSHSLAPTPASDEPVGLHDPSLSGLIDFGSAA